MEEDKINLENESIKKSLSDQNGNHLRKIPVAEIDKNGKSLKFEPIWYN